MDEARIELLAPAGNITCLHAAVRAGADAVYLGTEDFNARRGADNFTLDSLEDACNWAHLRGTKIYLTLNTMVLPSEVSRALELVRQAYRAGIDALIVQDIGIAAEISKSLPDLVLHASTQMNIHSAAGVAAVAQLGVERVTLARELSLGEIAHLSGVAHKLGISVETFAHGALCICYSGQCLMSSLVGGRSANRGVCAQACRLPYELHNSALRKTLDAPGEHLLSPKDLSSIDLLPELIDAGVDSLKIEGRMKQPEYVYNVVSTYRHVLDRCSSYTEQGNSLNKDNLSKARATSAEHYKLQEAFSRGFTEAYLAGETGQAMMSYSRPNNRGVRIGRVSSLTHGQVEIDCEVPLVQGDVLEFWTNKGRVTHTVETFETRAQNRFVVSVAKSEGGIGKGDRVFRVRSAQALFEDSAQDPRIPVSAELEMRQGKPLRLRLQSQDCSVSVVGAVVEAARTKAVSAQEVREHVDRFGNDPFYLDDFQLELDDGVGIGFSALHKLRAQASVELQNALLEPWTKRRLLKLPQSRKNAQPKAYVQRGQKPKVCAWVSNAACARVARKAGVDEIYVPALNYKRGEATVAGQKSKTVEQAGYPKQLIIALPAIDHDPVQGTREYEKAFDPWNYVRAGRTVFADSLASVYRALEAGLDVEVGPHIPVTNALSANYLAGLGVARIWLSPELNLGQIQRIAEESEVPLGLFVSGAAELMITQYCILQSQGPCNQDCEQCPRRLSPHYLKDRKGFEIPVITDCCGRSHLYNAIALDLCHVIPDLMGANVSAFMVDTTLLNTTQAAEAFSRALRARDLAQRTGDSIKKMEGATTGQLFRGVS